MKLHLHPKGPSGPCRQMEGFLNRKAEGTAGRFARWYALAHALRCSRCRKYLQALEVMIERLSQEREQRIPADVESRLTQIARTASRQIEG